MRHPVFEQRRQWFKSAFGMGLGIAGVVSGMGVTAQAVAHTPYKQWTVYRRKHLLLGCHKDEPETYALAKQLVAQLQDHLPAASARVARAPTAQRLASLMATDQLDSAILKQSVALRMAAGSDEFTAYGKIPLRKLMQLDQFVLVCRADIPEKHAYLIVDALESAENVQASPTVSNDIVDDIVDTQKLLPWHAGVVRLHAGGKL